MVQFVKNDSLKQHVILISDSKNKAVNAKLKSEFAGAKVIQSRKNKDGNDSYYILLEDIEEEFKEGRNIVFLHTSNEGFVSNVSSMLNSFVDDEHEIILMTTDHNRAFEGSNISNYHLSNLKFHYPSVPHRFEDRAAILRENGIEGFRTQFSHRVDSVCFIFAHHTRKPHNIGGHDRS